MKGKRLVAVCGKGGTGKTIFTAIMTKLLVKDKKSKILVIDADPAMGLPNALGVTINKTVGQIREEIIKSARTAKEEEKTWITKMLDYEILSALGEESGFGLLAMGRPESAGGCFCPVNALLRDAIETFSRNFDITLIDGEAGIEQIYRRVIRSVDTLVIITDTTVRGLQTAATIKKIAQSQKAVKCERMGLVINRVKGKKESIRKATQKMELEIFGFIPEDENITNYDFVGKPIIDLPDTSPSVIAVREILKNLSLIS